jgi:hypothetical protein
MHAAFKKAAAPAALMLAAATLAGCVVRPAPYYVGAYYAEQRPTYVQPRIYYGSRPSHWHRHRWHGGGWHSGQHHWDDD